MTPEEIKVYAGIVFQLVNAAATVGIWLYVRYGDRAKEIDQRFERLSADVDARLDEHGRDIQRLRGLNERAPTHEDLARIHDKINGTAQAVSAMGGKLDAMNDNLRLILTRIADRGMQ